MASTDDLTRAVESGSYKTDSDARLHELMAAALDIHGSNPIALHRISQAAAVVRQELAERDSKRREEAEQARHVRIDAQLSELKKPHWTVLPNFG